jgi:hypothetical protein
MPCCQVPMSNPCSDIMKCNCSFLPDAG